MLCSHVCILSQWCSSSLALSCTAFSMLSQHSWYSVKQIKWVKREMDVFKDLLRWRCLLGAMALKKGMWLWRKRWANREKYSWFLCKTCSAKAFQSTHLPGQLMEKVLAERDSRVVFSKHRIEKYTTDKEQRKGNVWVSIIDPPKALRIIEHNATMLLI